MSQANLIKLMLEGTYSCRELADETGLHYVTVLHYCRALHKAGAARIDSWGKDNRNRDAILIYKIGVGKDAKRHRRTCAERQQAARDKLAEHRKLLVLHGRGSYSQSKNGQLKFTAIYPEQS